MTADNKYLTYYLTNTDNTNNEIVMVNFNKTLTRIDDLDNLENYKLYICNLLITNVDVPYRNFYNNISWNTQNFTNNKLNLSISLYDESGNYTFNLNGNTNNLIQGINESGTQAGYYQGVLVYLSYYSENSNLPNPSDLNFISSVSYPSNYFNMYSLNHFCRIINNALLLGASKNLTLQSTTSNFYYDPTTQLYNFKGDATFFNSTVNIYFNSYLSHILDGFQTKNMQNFTASVGSVNYTGMNFLLLKTGYQPQQYLLQSEYSCINNISDVIGVIISVDQSLAGARPAIYQDMSSKSILSNSERIIKQLDFIFDNTLSANNIIQYEDLVLDKSIDINSSKSLDNIQINIKLLKSDGTTENLYIRGGGYASIKIALKKNIIKYR